MALTNDQLERRKKLLNDIEKREENIAAHTAVIEKGEGLTNKQLEKRARMRAKEDAENKKRRAELAEMQKDEDKINAAYQRRNDLAKEYSTVNRDIQNSIKNQPKFLKDINVERSGIVENIYKAEKLEAKGSSNMTRRQKKELSMRQGIGETIQSILDNSMNVATSEFMTYDLQKKINWARREGDDTLLHTLETMDNIQKSQKRMNDIAIEGSNALRAPMDKIREIIESAPGGKFLSKVLGLEDLADSIGDSFITGFREIIGLGERLPESENIAEKVMGSKGRMVTEGGKAHQRDVASGWFDSDEFKKGADAQKEAKDDAKEQAEASEKTKDAVEGASKGMGGLKLGAIAVLAAVVAWVVETVKFSMELGVAMSELNTAMILFKDQTKAVLAEFGSLRGVSSGLLTDMFMMEKLHGVQAADMAKILVLQTALTDQTREMALDEQEKLIKQIKKEGLSARDVFADMAANADFIAVNMKKGTNNMVDAAKQAAKMGLSLNETAAVANKLLDWETSIKDEMELSVLLNRNINFDRARQLMLAGKQAEMMKEVKKQMGGEAEFAKAGVIERMKMAEAIGLQGAALAEFMMTDQQRVEAEKKAQEEAQAKERQAASEKAKMWGIIGGIAGAVIVAIGAGLAAAVSLGALTGAGIAWTLLGMTTGGAVGMAAGKALAGSGEKIGAGVITPKGEVVHTDPMDYIMGITKQEAQQSSAIKSSSTEPAKAPLTQEQGEIIISHLKNAPTSDTFETMTRDLINATKKVGTQV